ncbi:hypothetical protein LUZ63_024337 [Rhynchospora breviuscula]|uniref:Uncharacterized protein n=1 Tax=Rhynchospora breviuscula TaxID=2022672 RepID=A0A9Q0BW63_9POAL|nr:hypothetical protein LUZ63_024337 [Rhynchospora breviuscula]
MALRFPRFSQGLAQDPTTRRIWFGIATAHDFEIHDDITEERLYQNIFASHFGQLAIIFLWTSGNLPIAHAIWIPILANQLWKPLLEEVLLVQSILLIRLGVGSIYNPNGNQAFRGSRMPNLVSIIICQDFSEYTTAPPRIGTPSYGSVESLCPKP